MRYLLLFFLSFPAYATVIDLRFQNGEVIGTAELVYDAGMRVFYASDWDITSTGGFPDFHYTPQTTEQNSCINHDGQLCLNLHTADLARQLFLLFQPDTFALITDPDLAGQPTNKPSFEYLNGIYRFAVPEPSTAFLLLILLVTTSTRHRCPLLLKKALLH